MLTADYLGVLGILAAPVWTSYIVARIQLQHPIWAFFVAAVTLAMAYVMWWFYWGGGIGGEAHLAPALQILLISALAPTVTIIVRNKRENSRK
jgi:hypothetical protein